MKFGEQGVEILRELPDKASLAVQVDVMMDQLVARRLVAETLQRLRIAFPRRLAEIDAVARSWSPETVKTDLANIIVHPRDQEFEMSGEWEDDGLVIRGGKLTLPAKETHALFTGWIGSISNLKGIAQKSADLQEEAFIRASFRAFLDVYERVPDGEELERGVSILSRKMNLFFSFARAAALQAQNKNIDLNNCVLGGFASSQRRTLLRVFLQTYVLRLCDVNLDSVEGVENILSKTPRWEQIVERVYGVNEDLEKLVVGMFNAVRIGVSDVGDEDVAVHIVRRLIGLQLGIEDFPIGS